MTTRQILNRRHYRGMGFLILLVFALVGWRWLGRTPTVNTIADMLGALGLGGVMVYWWRTPCAHCHKPLGGLTTTVSGPAARQMSSPNCEHCGVSIDHDCATS